MTPTTTKLITLGCDVGLRFVGWAVLDEHLLAHGVWDLKETPPGWTPDAWLHGLADNLLHHYYIKLIALERFHYRGHATRAMIIPKAPDIDAHLGCLLSFGTPNRTIMRYTAAQWMKQVMGYLPRDRHLESHTWKAQLRHQIGLLLHYRWPPIKPSNPLAYHDNEAAGIALVARSEAMIFARLKT